MKLAKFKFESGQTLIEMIIAIGLVVLVLTTLVSALTLGIKNNRFAREQSQAKNYVREGTEWARSIRDRLGWESFYDMVAQDGNPVSYCLSSLPTTAQDAEELTNRICTSQETINNTVFRRTAFFSFGNTDKELTLTVTVDWNDGSAIHTSTSTIILRQWI